jgi:FAD/FMN-containing dehydrogenase
MTGSSYEQALNTLEKTFKDRIRRPSGDNETKSGALASVLPLRAEEVELLAREAARYSMPLAAVGGGTSPEPISEEGKLLVRFDLMRGVRLPHRDGGWVEAEPGTPWLKLDEELRLRDMGLTVYPTSAPRATVGGWLATDGLGVGSFEFGRLRNNVLSASVVLPGGERREVPGEEVGSSFSTGTAEGIVVGARFRTRRADADKPFATAFGGAADMTGAVTDLCDTSVPLWHLAVLNPAMARARNLGTMHLMFGAYPRERTNEVENRLRRVVESNRGLLLPASDAHRVWGERYFPIRPSILPPGFPGLSREFSSVAELPQKLEQVENSATSVALQGTIARSGEILLLTLDAREMAQVVR